MSNLQVYRVGEVVPARNIEEMLQTAIDSHDYATCRSEPEISSVSTERNTGHEKTLMTGSAVVYLQDPYTPCKYTVSFEVNHGSSKESEAIFQDLEVTAILEEVYQE